MEKVRDLHNCSKCGVGFRPSLEQEILCAKCQVQTGGTINDPAELERQFLDIAGKVYGTQSTEKLYNIFGLVDVFNHKQRLLKLMMDLEETNERNKERIKRRREINRLMEEHDAVQNALVDVQAKFLRKMMLDPDMQFLGSSRGKVVSTVMTSPQKEQSLQSPVSPKARISSPQTKRDFPADEIVGTETKRSNSVRDRIKMILNPEVKFLESPKSISHTITPNKQQAPSSPKPKVSSPHAELPSDELVGTEFKRKGSVRDRIKILSPDMPSPESSRYKPVMPIPFKEQPAVSPNIPIPRTPDLPEEEIVGTEFKRSNSVRDRIKGYEERIRRTVSTGFSDRPTVLKRQLF